MVTYELKKAPGVPLYEALYRCIRGDILSGKLKPGEKLPSKRALAQNLEAVERPAAPERESKNLPAAEEQKWILDLTANGTEQFPFSVWMKLQREVMLDYGQALLLPLPNRGVTELRQAIADHLSDFRGMRVEPENILIGAGTDFLYNLLMQLLGREKIYAVEEPGYGKIRRIYAAGGVSCVSAPMDAQGVIPEGLQSADVLHCSPSHHFPTGLVTPVSRRMELLSWAGDSRWIIEDDYDSEFRFDAHPMPAMQALDGKGRVIYMNTFSKSITPSIRISYMVLPPDLMRQFQSRLGFYSCTVPSFEQYTLARFLSRGYFEKHINRMRKLYKNRRNLVISFLNRCPFADRLTILEQDAGLHFLLKVDTVLTDGELTERLARAGIRVQALSEFYHDSGEDQKCLVINYSGIREDELEQAMDAIKGIM